MPEQERPHSRLKVWLVAVRPFAYTASVTSVGLGLALSYYAGYPVRGVLFGLTLVGMLCFHTAANLLNDCYDYRCGLDTEVRPTSGAVVRGWLTERQVHRAAVGTLAAGILCGVLLAVRTGWPVLCIGLIGTAIAVGYTRPGVCFKYVGSGDAAIFLAFGVLPVLGTYWVQARAFSWTPVLWSLPLAALTVAIVHANNWRDLAFDPSHGCRTVASVLGEKSSGRYYRALVLGPFALIALYLLLSRLGVPREPAPMTPLLAFLAFPLAVRLARPGSPDETRMAALDAETAKLQLAFGVLLPLGFLFARLLGRG